jgi:hypothetical protein
VGEGGRGDMITDRRTWFWRTHKCNRRVVPAPVTAQRKRACCCNHGLQARHRCNASCRLKIVVHGRLFDSYHDLTET